MNIFKNKILIIGLVILLILIITTLLLLRESRVKKKLPSFVNTQDEDQVNKSITPRLIKNLEKQTQADLDFGKWDQNIQDNYIWYDFLPLQTDSYFVYFDLDKRTFYATIYKIADAPKIKEEIVSRLKGMGVNTEKYSIVWD
ncbi:MAG TPA: hypothetical protein VK338_04665 [Candidatus Nitrosocosmicus sp.]|nr:hypothetical protein [Candidatus Nitrosocosmicus sp.]